MMVKQYTKSKTNLISSCWVSADENFSYQFIVVRLHIKFRIISVSGYWVLAAENVCGRTDRRTVDGKTYNAPDAYRRGHKNMVPIVPDKKIFFHRISNVELSSVLIVILVRY